MTISGTEFIWFYCMIIKVYVTCFSVQLSLNYLCGLFMTLASGINVFMSSPIFVNGKQQTNLMLAMSSEWGNILLSECISILAEN